MGKTFFVSREPEQIEKAWHNLQREIYTIAKYLHLSTDDISKLTPEERTVMIEMLAEDMKPKTKDPSKLPLRGLPASSPAYGRQR